MRTVSNNNYDVSTFEKSQTKRSVMQLLNTLLPFLALLSASYYLTLEVSYWLAFPVILVAAGFLVRIFIIFHDSCHHSFFKSRKANEIVGTITGIMTLHPYRQWRHTHTVHHATSGNLNKRGMGDIWLLTVNEYLQLSKLKRFGYRLYRNPIVMFVLGPIYIFMIENRFNRKAAKSKERINTYLTNVGIVVIAAILCSIFGWKAFLLIQFPIMYFAGMAGIWLFYVQHQFETGYFEKEEEWDFLKAAVEGSSFYKLPKILQWFSGNIGYHHVHHLSPRVPNYLLEKAHDQTSGLREVRTVTLATSLKSINYRLWDEETKSFVSFRYLKKSAAQPTPVLHA